MTSTQQWLTFNSRDMSSLRHSSYVQYIEVSITSAVVLAMAGKFIDIADRLLILGFMQAADSNYSLIKAKSTGVTRKHRLQSCGSRRLIHDIPQNLNGWIHTGKTEDLHSSKVLQHDRDERRSKLVRTCLSALKESRFMFLRLYMINRKLGKGSQATSRLYKLGNVSIFLLCKCARGGLCMPAICST